MDCSPPGSSVHEILQARILEWVAVPFSRGSSQSRDGPRSPALQADSLPLSHQGSPDILIWVHNKADFKKPKKKLLKSEKTIFIWKGLLSVVLSSQEGMLFWDQSVQDV